ncbi:MAG TPA: hypothetical protein VNO32_65585 [Candidatus Acidoferrum sp.]|jgi:hypothetical protein|nr:hypothetical protein [Candidatus Acidoferrum sp.]
MMIKRSYVWLFVPLVSVALLVGLTVLRPNRVNAQPAQQYPILDKVAAKVIAKYQNSSCEQLYQQKSQKAPPTPEEQKVVQFLHSDPQMKTVFINKVAAPIANKMFDCGLLP